MSDRDEYDDLLNDLREVRSTISEWRSSEDFFDGDQGFQRLLERESDLQQRLDALNE